MIESWLVNTLLKWIDDLGKPFPIPMKITGQEVLFEAWNHPLGLVVCLVHLPLWNLITRSLVELNRIPTVTLASRKVLKDGMFFPWGCPVGLPALAVDKYVLIKARSILRGGGSVVTMVDRGLGDALNSNIFRLMRSVGARAVFATVELQRSGETLVQYFNPPDPLNETDASIMANIRYFEAIVHKVTHLDERPERPRGKAEAIF